MAAFRWAADGHGFRVLDTDLFYEVGELVYINSASISVFNLRPGQTVTLADCRLAYATVEFWRRLRSEVSFEDGPKRVFFARRHGRRDYNQEEVASLLKKRGFTLVYPEDLTVRQQAALVCSAEALVGPSGAAWTNLLFAERGAVGVSWLPEPYREAAVYSTLARRVGVALEFVLYPTTARTTGELYLADYRLDLERLEEAVELALAAK